MKQYDIGIDLGTTSIIIATEEQGVVFRQPTIGAVDTRTNSILAVGDEALKMVGRAPAHIDLVRPLRDGIIQDHRMTNELIVRFVNQVCRSRIFKPRIGRAHRTVNNWVTQRPCHVRRNRDRARQINRFNPGQAPQRISRAIIAGLRK